MMKCLTRPIPEVARPDVSRRRASIEHGSWT